MEKTIRLKDRGGGGRTHCGRSGGLGPAWPLTVTFAFRNAVEHGFTPQQSMALATNRELKPVYNDPRFAAAGGKRPRRKTRITGHVILFVIGAAGTERGR